MFESLTWRLLEEAADFGSDLEGRLNEIAAADRSRQTSVALPARILTTRH